MKCKLLSFFYEYLKPIERAGRCHEAFDSKHMSTRGLRVRISHIWFAINALHIAAHRSLKSYNHSMTQLEDDCVPVCHTMLADRGIVNYLTD
jgi:hypothetical protein